MLEEVLEEVGSPVRRRGRPDHLEAAGDGVAALAAAVGAAPAEALLLEGSGLRLGADVVGGTRAVRLAEGVPAGDQRDGLLVVHRHPAERLADVARGGQRVRVAVRTLGVHVDEAHLHGPQRAAELAVAAVALVAEPGVLRTPEDLLRLPHVRPAEAEAEGREAHRLQRDVAGEDQQVGPRDRRAVLLLDRPQQPARLVEVRVVGPAVQRGEPLRALATAAAAVLDPVGAGRVPAHPDEQRPVVAVVRRPPVLRRGHDVHDVLLQRLDIEGREGIGVPEVLAHRVALRRVLVQHAQVQLVGPPVLVRVRPARLRGRRIDGRVLALAAVRGHVARVRLGLVRHGSSSSPWCGTVQCDVVR